MYVWVRACVCVCDFVCALVVFCLCVCVSVFAFCVFGRGLGWNRCMHVCMQESVDGILSLTTMNMVGNTFKK